MAKTLKEGDRAPLFKLETDSGDQLALKDLKGKPIVLYFYPKDQTPGCTLEACDFRDSFARFKKKGILVLGISKDSVAAHAKFVEKFDLPFPLLSDPTGKVCESYGVWKEKMLYGKKFMGIERGTFLIGADGKIKKIFPKVKVKGHVDEVLSAFVQIA